VAELSQKLGAKPGAEVLDFDAVQSTGLAHGLVDNKSASIDGTWQALRFVYRREDR